MLGRNKVLLATFIVLPSVSALALAVALPLAFRNGNKSNSKSTSRTEKDIVTPDFKNFKKAIFPNNKTEFLNFGINSQELDGFTYEKKMELLKSNFEVIITSFVKTKLIETKCSKFDLLSFSLFSSREKGSRDFVLSDLSKLIWEHHKRKEGLINETNFDKPPDFYKIKSFFKDIYNLPPGFNYELSAYDNSGILVLSVNFDLTIAKDVGGSRFSVLKSVFEWMKPYCETISNNYQNNWLKLSDENNGSFQFGMKIISKEMGSSLFPSISYSRLVGFPKQDKDFATTNIVIDSSYLADISQTSLEHVKDKFKENISLDVDENDNFVPAFPFAHYYSIEEMGVMVTASQFNMMESTSSEYDTDVCYWYNDKTQGPLMSINFPASTYLKQFVYKDNGLPDAMIDLVRNYLEINGGDISHEGIKHLYSKGYLMLHNLVSNPSEKINSDSFLKYIVENVGKINFFAQPVSFHDDELTHVSYWNYQIPFSGPSWQGNSSSDSKTSTISNIIHNAQFTALAVWLKEQLRDYVKNPIIHDKHKKVHIHIPAIGGGYFRNPSNSIASGWATFVASMIPEIMADHVRIHFHGNKKQTLELFSKSLQMLRFKTKDTDKDTNEIRLFASSSDAEKFAEKLKEIVTCRY